MQPLLRVLLALKRKPRIFPALIEHSYDRFVDESLQHKEQYREVHDLRDEYRPFDAECVDEFLHD